MAGDKGFKKSEGFNQEDKMENPEGQVGPDDHGWAPDSGPTSEPNKRAGDKAHMKPEEAERADRK